MIKGKWLCSWPSPLPEVWSHHNCCMLVSLHSATQRLCSQRGGTCGIHRTTGAMQTWCSNYLEKVIIPYFTKAREQLELPADSPGLVIYLWSVRCTLIMWCHSILKLLGDNNIQVFVPAGCTGDLQPLDVSVNNPFKQKVKEMSHTGMPGRSVSSSMKAEMLRVSLLISQSQSSSHCMHTGFSVQWRISLVTEMLFSVASRRQESETLWTLPGVLTLMFQKNASHKLREWHWP